MKERLRNSLVPVRWLSRRYRKKYHLLIETSSFRDRRTFQLVENPETGVKKFTPSLVGDADFYESLSKFEWYYQTDKAEYHTAARITRGQAICEIGCGAGSFFAISGAKSYVGLELNDGAATEAKKNGLDVRLQGVSEHVQDVGPESYDVVCGFQVLEHVDDPESFLHHAMKLTRQGGWLIFSVPSDDSFVGLVPNNALNMPPHHQTRWTDMGLENIGKKAELQTIAIIHENLDPIHARWAIRSVVERVLFGSEKRVFDRYRSVKLALATVLSTFFPHSRQVAPIVLKGHTVTAIYRKPFI